MAILILFLLLIALGGSGAAIGQARERVIKFPSDYGLGTLCAYQRTAQKTKGTLLSKHAAQGDVHVPASSFRVLYVGYQKDLSALERLRPDDLDEVSFVQYQSVEQGTVPPMNSPEWAGYRSAREKEWRQQHIHPDGENVLNTGLRHLRNLQALRALAINSMDKATTGLDHLTGLKILDLCPVIPKSGAQSIDNAVLQRVAALKGLEELNLSRTELTDKGIPYLKALSSLKVLNIQNTNVSPQGIEALKRALPRCTILSGKTSPV